MGIPGDGVRNAFDIRYRESSTYIVIHNQLAQNFGWVRCGVCRAVDVRPRVERTDIDVKEDAHEYCCFTPGDRILDKS